MKLSLLKQNFEKYGLYIKTIENKSILKQVRDCIKEFFYSDSSNLRWSHELSKEDFHELTLNCQNKINEIGVQQKIFKSEEKFLKNICDDEILHESVCFLRAIRPANSSLTNEAVDYHRETMYSDDSHTTKAINIWIPILNVNHETSLRYIPSSHLVDDKDIIVQEDKVASRVEKGSTGHKLGFLYAPKKIISGVNFNNAERIKFPDDGYACFSAMLVHGGGNNTSNDIRFALSIGLLPKSSAKGIKPFTAANGKPQFVEFNGL